MARKNTKQAKADTKPEPGPRNREALNEAITQWLQRPVRVSVRFETGPDGGTVLGAPHSDTSSHQIRLQNAMGTTSPMFVASTLAQLECAVRGHGTDGALDNPSFNAALALIEAVKPDDELEAALAAQMAGCHAAAMDMLGRARHATSTEHLALYGNMATKLQRTFTAQIEALARMRGKGQQTVRVEHVTVQAGAQAIVGDVHHHPRGSRGAQAKSEEQPYESGEAALGAQACEALPGPDASRDGVPIPSDAERPVPPARRTVTRRAARKPKRLQARPLER